MFTSGSFAWKVTFTSSTHSHYILITRRRRESCWDWSHPAMRMPSLTTTSPSSGSVRTLLLLKKKWIAMLLLVDNLVLWVIPLLLPTISLCTTFRALFTSFISGRESSRFAEQKTLTYQKSFRAFHRVLYWLYSLYDLLLLNMLEAIQNFRNLWLKK